jgi:hypothetical protein
MSTDFRALCAGLTAALHDWQCKTDDDGYADLINLARAALAQPEPVADGELAEPPEAPIWLNNAEAAAWQSGWTYSAANLLERLAVPGTEPVGEGPSELELEAIELVLWDKHRTKGWGGEEFMYDNDFSSALDEYRAVLARWGRQPASDAPASCPPGG